MRKVGKLFMDPKVSIIISTKNEEKNIETCLKSLQSQSYKNIEIIVIDNFSSDKTEDIAKKYTPLVYRVGPERSAQRNFGATKAKGRFLLFIDADMVVTENVIGQCVRFCLSKKGVNAIVIPEKSYGKSFWAKCKGLERSFYEGIEWIEGARFFDRKLFLNVGGYNTALISGEDWDIHARFKKKSKIGRINSYILHNEGNLSIAETVKTKYYYAKSIRLYKDITEDSRFKSQSSVVKRYMLFFSKPKMLFSNPFLGIGMLIMKSSEYIAGLIGYFISKK